jgi:hypothetical protein
MALPVPCHCGAGYAVRKRALLGGPTTGTSSSPLRGAGVHAHAPARVRSNGPWPPPFSRVAQRCTRAISFGRCHELTSDACGGIHNSRTQGRGPDSAAGQGAGAVPSGVGAATSCTPDRARAVLVAPEHASRRAQAPSVSRPRRRVAGYPEATGATRRWGRSPN